MLLFRNCFSIGENLISTYTSAAITFCHSVQIIVAVTVQKRAFVICLRFGSYINANKSCVSSP